MKKDKNKIMFLLYENERLFSDVFDTYYWIALQDQKIADKYLNKATKARSLIEKRLKEIESIESAKAMQIEYKVKEKGWWKKLWK